MTTPFSHPRGFTKYVLFLDTETSGLALGSDDPSINKNTGEKYQMLSAGLIVVDSEDLSTVDELYVEMQYDPTEYVWTDSAFKVHGLSQAYLADNGQTEGQVVCEIGSLLSKYWDISKDSIVLGGHNVGSFDRWFLLRHLRAQQVPIKISNRAIDTYSVGYTVFGTYNSDDLFKVCDLPQRNPNNHNALDDARYALSVIQLARQIVDVI